MTFILPKPRKKREEENDQIHFVTYARAKYPGIITLISPIAKFSGSTPGARMAQGKRINAMGYMKGTLDLFIPEPRGVYHGLVIELKKKSGGVVSDEQIEMVSKLESKGHYVVVARGCQEACNFLDYYMSFPKRF